eukprot:4449559-Pleurochrysis_carterae.AAC.2
MSSIAPLLFARDANNMPMGTFLSCSHCTFAVIVLLSDSMGKSMSSAPVETLGPMRMPRRALPRGRRHPRHARLLTRLSSCAARAGTALVWTRPQGKARASTQRANTHPPFLSKEYTPRRHTLYQISTFTASSSLIAQPGKWPGQHRVVGIRGRARIERTCTFD